jgi:voltage-gated potassium channel
MPNLRVVERRFAKFMRQPLSVRMAMAVIVTATVASVFVGGFLMTLVDKAEYPDMGTGMWWAVQTVTTVGYGDVTPANGVGKLVGALFMLEAIAFIAIVTAAITSSFVERARREQDARMVPATSGQETTDQLAAALGDIAARLDRIERALPTQLAADPPPGAP